MLAWLVMLEHNDRQVAITRDMRAQRIISYICREQKAVMSSHSTLESELVAADYGLRTDGLLAFSLWRVLFSSSASIVVPRGQPGDDSRRFHW